ncbi:histidine phosphatase family protein [Thalassobacillus devorans]|uniref:histidine phosphatase family protein n=1 Tax=Thalassobacillus devorans TaxID=279813 RepID=UPI0004B0F68B|nr:histidine phosphatase family protein [Thalassobacillus devorans]
MRACFVRHGETDWNREGRLQGHTATSLNATGIWQTRQCAERLVGEGWDVILSSPLQRARESAHILSAYTGVPHFVSPLFTELDYGQWNGQKKELLITNHTFIKWYRIEINKLEKLVKKEWEALIHTYKNDAVIVVTHGLVIQQIEKVLNRKSQPDSEVISNGSFINVQV